MLRLAESFLPAHRDAPGVRGTSGCGRTARMASRATNPFVAAS